MHADRDRHCCTGTLDLVDVRGWYSWSVGITPLAFAQENSYDLIRLCVYV